MKTLTKSIMVIMVITICTGCASLLAPPAGTHYKVKYGEIEVEVDDWTDKKGVEFEYVNGDTKIKLKKDEVDTATPAAVLQQKQAENQQKALDAINKLITHNRGS